MQHSTPCNKVVLTTRSDIDKWVSSVAQIGEALATLDLLPFRWVFANVNAFARDLHAARGYDLPPDPASFDKVVYAAVLYDAYTICCQLYYMLYAACCAVYCILYCMLCCRLHWMLYAACWIACCLLPAACCLLPAACCTVCCMLHAACCMLHAACCMMHYVLYLYAV